MGTFIQLPINGNKGDNGMYSTAHDLRKRYQCSYVQSAKERCVLSILVTLIMQRKKVEIAMWLRCIRSTCTICNQVIVKFPAT